MPTLTIAHDTIAKHSARQSSDLPPEQQSRLRAGSYEILAYGEAATDTRYQGQPMASSHMVVTFDPENNPTEVYAPDGVRCNTVVLWHGHASVEGNLPANNPVEVVPIIQTPKGRVVTLAGLGPRGLSAPIDGCQFFTWSEATRAGTRMPDTAQQSKNIVELAKYLDLIRAKLGGRTISITSWLRPEKINQAVGGARNSTHIQGYAADFAVAGMTPRQVFAELDGWHGAKGGLAHGRTFVHVDLRKPSYRARWQYPGV